MTTIVQLVTALGAIVTAALTLQPRRRRRAELKLSLELLRLLPSDSTARPVLLNSIDGKIIDLVHREDDLRRHVPGVLSGIYLAVAGPALALTGFLMPWAAPAWVAATIIGVIAIAESAPLAARNERGLQLQHEASGN